MTSSDGPLRDGLPVEPTPFIGRRRELAALRSAMDRSRLVTLCGPGGVGKTRLALAVAAGLRADFPDGMRFVELSALREPELLPRTVAATWGLPDTADGDPLERLAAHLAGKRVLLVLDTCEHLVDACARLAERLVRAAPQLQVLATSRELLDVLGEHTITVEPMPVPAPDDPLTGEEYDAVALFAERAAASAPGFTLTPANRAAVTRLCHRTEGLPLAIELAAVRLATTPVERLADRLDASLRLRGRHRRAAVEWSRDLCDERERLLWARLSVFPGGFDAATATAVCADPAAPAGSLPAAVLPEVLERLVKRSLVRHDPVTGRYRMLDTLREYGAELLAEEGGRAELCRRHLAHVASLAERTGREALSGGQDGWFRRLREADADLRVALEWALATPGEREAGLRLTVLLRGYWYSTGRFGEGRAWHRRALAAVPEDAPGRGWALYGEGMFAVLQGDMAAGDPLLARALAAADALGDAELRAHVLHEQGRSRFHEGDLEAAERLFLEADALHRSTGGYRTLDALTLFADLGSVLALRGDRAGAVARCEEALELCGAAGERWARAFALWMRGAARWLEGDLDAAEADVRECLRIKVEFDDLMGVAMALDLLMVCAATRGDHARAAVLTGASEVLWERLRAPVLRGPHYAALRAEGVAATGRALGAAAMAAAVERGRTMALAWAVAFALGEEDLVSGVPEPRGSA